MRKRPPSGTAIIFDLDYDLLLASEREARRQLLAPWQCSRSPPEKARLGKFVDPYVARELHRQELRDKELRDVLNALFGKAGDWRVALCIEARRNDYARGELERAIGSVRPRATHVRLTAFLRRSRRLTGSRSAARSKPPRHGRSALFWVAAFVASRCPQRGKCSDLCNRDWHREASIA